MLKRKGPRVLVGCPTSDHKKYCLEEYAKAVGALSYDNYDVLLVDNSKDDEYLKGLEGLGLKVVKEKYSEPAADRVIRSRNVLRDVVLKDYDYFLSLEQDVIPPVNVIEKLLGWNKKIVSGIVCHLSPVVENGKKVMVEKPLVGIENKKDGKFSFFSVQQVLDVGNSLVKVDYCPMGCLLMHKDVLRDVRFRYEEYGKSKGNEDDVKWDDICFCTDAKAKGENIYADFGVRCMHKLLGGYSITLGDLSKVKRLK